MEEEQKQNQNIITERVDIGSIIPFFNREILLLIMMLMLTASLGLLTWQYTGVVNTYNENVAELNECLNSTFALLRPQPPQLPSDFADRFKDFVSEPAPPPKPPSRGGGLVYDYNES